MQIDLRRDQRCGFEFVGRSMLCHGRVAELITTQSPRIGASRISFTKNLVELGAVAQASRGELSGDFAAVLDLFEQSVGRPLPMESNFRGARRNILRPLLMGAIMRDHRRDGNFAPVTYRPEKRGELI